MQMPPVAGFGSLPVTLAIAAVAGGLCFVSVAGLLMRFDDEERMAKSFVKSGTPAVASIVDFTCGLSFVGSMGCIGDALITAGIKAPYEKGIS